MPIHDYRCSACGETFELLVRSSTVAACPHCASTALDKQLSLTAPQGTSKAVIAAGRRAAAKQGHFSNYAKADRDKVR
jgi:putative FmdB family regulatory protein